jgi:hypothetical protein
MTWGNSNINFSQLIFELKNAGFIDINTKKVKWLSAICIIFCNIIFSILWILLFYYFTEDPANYGASKDSHG